jgi:hypothetical protein
MIFVKLDKLNKYNLFDPLSYNNNFDNTDLYCSMSS